MRMVSKKSPEHGYKLVIDPAMGMAGDMFSAALVGLGASASMVTGTMERTGRRLGNVSVRTENAVVNQQVAVRLRTDLQVKDSHLAADRARQILNAAIDQEGLSAPYAEFGRRVLEILIEAEREAHSKDEFNEGTLSLQPIGYVHTPYHDRAPRQPGRESEDDFWVEVSPDLATGLRGLKTFSHIHVISYLQRSSGYSLTVTPPWQEGQKARTVGLFASRSPNRPSPLGLSTVRVRRIDSNRIHTSPLDLFDGTPVVDIKPHLRSLDETGLGNDGWLTGTDHLELHKEGVPHQHDGEEAILHEVQDVILDVMGAAKGLELLEVSMSETVCLSPVSVGGGKVKCSHGVLSVPPPAVMAILRRYRIPHVAGPVNTELLTPTGAALLAALEPTWCPRDSVPENKIVRKAMGAGTKELDRPNLLRLAVGQI